MKQIRCAQCGGWLKHATGCTAWACDKCGCFAPRADRRTSHRGSPGNRSGRRRGSRRQVCLPCFQDGQLNARRVKKSMRNETTGDTTP
jgi:hypothetical protein